MTFSRLRPKVSASISTASALLLLSGCIALSPKRVEPELGVTVPAGWIAGTSTSADVVDRWWDTFDDARLSRTIAEAIDRNHDLQAAAARIRTAGAEARIVAADLAPQIGGNFDASRSQQVIDPGASPQGGGIGGLFSGLGWTEVGGFEIPEFDVPDTGGGEVTNFRTNSFGVSMNLSWEIDLWGRLRSGAMAAYAELEAQEADYAARALSLAAQTAKAYFAVTEARLQLELAQATAKSFRETARVATDRVDAGVQPPTDKHLAVSNYESAEALVEQRRATLRQTSRQLEVLVGRYPDGKDYGGKSLPRLGSSPPAGIPAGIIRRRPDIIVAERQTAAANKRIDAAVASFFPRISLTGSGGTQTSDLANLLDGSFGVWTIAGNLMQPIFQGGRLIAQLQGSKGRFREAAELFAQQVLTAFGEVETALSLEQVLAAREGYLRKSSTAADAAQSVAQNRYVQGVESFLTVLESQRRALDANSARISAQRAQLDNRVDLFLALGGGFRLAVTPASVRR